MLFNSIDFAIFLPIVFMLYWSLNRVNLKVQNAVIVLASYTFYGWWDWRFLSLIIVSTLVDYVVGRSLNKTEHISSRKALLWTSVLVNIGLLGFFKYYNFFVDNFITAFSFFGSAISPNTLDIVLPVGISFYTFQTLSYTIDVYKRKLEPTKDIISFAAFVSFFPQLVAGPIERATNLLPQFYKRREFEYSNAVDGMRQILWGLFKKVVIADNCAVYANLIFGSSEEMSGSTLFLGAIFFAFQIYGDFSGYSDIAIGTSGLFGFNIMRNFAFPYFSRDIAEFWRRWHISLSTWFRDYIYIPLGGSRGSDWAKIRNVFIIFIVSGFWHGANWTFIAWGALNAIYFLPLLLLKKNRKNTDVIATNNLFPKLREAITVVGTFLLTTLAWIFFRAETIDHAFNIFAEVFSMSLFSIPTFDGIDESATTIYLTLLFIGIEWIGRDQEYALESLGKNWWKPLRYALYYLLVVSLFWFGGHDQQFLYFQF